MSSKSGSSRRKPQVVRKVFDGSDEEGNDENSNTDKEINGDDDTVNGDGDMEVNGDDAIPEELPEGTVVVEPEAVEDSNSSFKGPEFSSKRKSDIGYLSIVTCSACGKQINTNQPGEARQHPDLKVLTCKSCYKFYKSGPITQDEDGLDEQCRWCSEGGKLFGCDFCNNTFCRSCIVRNLGRSELSVVQDEDSQWKCYMCNPKPLYGLVENCNKILEKIAQEKEKEKQKILDTKKKSITVGADQTSSKSSNKEKSKTDTPKTKEDKKSSELGNKIKSGEAEKNTDKKPLPTVNSLLAAPPVQNQPPVHTKIQYVYLQSQATPNIDANTIFGNSVHPRNIHAVIDKLISVTRSLELLLSSIRVNIQNDQEQDFMMSGITFENRKKAVECVKSGVDLFLDELKQIDKISSVASYNSNTNTSVMNQSYSLGQNSGESIQPKSSSLLAATLTGNTQGFQKIEPKPDPGNLDVSKVQDEASKENEDAKKEENDSEMKSEEKTETENNDQAETDQNDDATSDSKVGEEENSKDEEEKMEVDDNESNAKTSDKDDEAKAEKKSDEESTEESDTSTSDDDDDDSDEVSSGDFDESWGGSKRRKTRQTKKKNENTKKDKKDRKKKRKKEKEKPKSKLNISFKFGSKKKNDDDEEENDDGSENEFEDSKSKSKKSKDKKEKSKSKSKKNSDLENSDSDLDDEIDKLAKDTPKKKKKKASEKPTDDDDNDDNGSGDDDDKGKKKKEAKKSEKDQKEKKKDKKKITDSSSDDGDDDDKDGDNYDDETEEEKEETGDLPFDQNDEDTEEEGNKDENVKAKEDLLKELQDSTTEDGSSDSEVVINSPKKKATKKKSSKETVKASDDTDSDVVSSPKKKKKTRSSLLEAKISDSDSDFQTPKKKRGKKRKASSSEDKSESESDSDSESDKKKKKGKKGAKGKKETQKGKRRRRIKKQSSSDDDENASEEEEGSDDESQTPGGVGKRKKIRKVKSDKKLTDATKEAVKAEEDRRKRIADRQKQFNNIVQEVDESSPVKCPMTTQLVLEEDKETKKPIIEIDKNLVRMLKPHQVEAVQFIWDCTMETLERAKKEEGAGCILAHCMGLGKTLTLITFMHTMLVNQKKTKMRKALVVCPLNTVLNWQREFEMWQEHTKKEVEVFELSSVKQNFDRAQMLQNWHNDGGVMIIGYEMFRILSGGTMCRNKKQKQIFAEALVDPGPDLVVCDEGHILKNDTSSISKAMNKIRSKRRVVLTGTPLQNNLVEYHCMVNFVKPNLLGTSKEFRNRFVNPISNGQCADSTMQDVKVMKRRAHILHEKLAGCVQRKDYSALTKFLPQKHEYVISVRLSKVQVGLYGKYLNMTIGDTVRVSNKGGKLFQDYQNLMRIWTHPWVLKMDEVIKERRAIFEEDDEFIDDSMSESDSEGSGSKKSSSSSSDDDVIPVDSDSDSNNKGKKTRSTRQTRQRGKEEKETSDDKEEPKREVFAGEVVKKWTTRSRGNEEDYAEMIRRAQEEEENKPLTTEWWAEFVSKEDFNRMELSGKLMLLFEILRMCEEIGDKILVFSQSLLSLDLIEDFLEIVDNKHQEETKDKEDEELADGQGFGKHWTKGEDYFRMDGSTGPQQRKDMAIAFNDPENYRARLFLISTKAGSLGINLVGANRVIIFDASWNPSHDVQSIFRVYRFGQTKPVYVYRFLAQATMEEKIYERQIIKLSLSQRVVDEHQIERHFNSSDLQELYTFKPDILDDPNRTERPTPVLPKDHMLAELFKSHKDWIVTYHEHDSLLENKTEEELSEEERKAAWEDYEQEQKGITMSAQNFLGNMRFPMAGMNQMGFNMPMPGMRMPGQPGMPQMALNHHHLLQLVQEMKAKFPFLPQDQLTARVQGVIRSMLSNQIMQQHDVQRRQVEQQEMQHHQQLQQIQAQIRQQQQQMNMRFTNPSQQMRMGMNPGSNFGGMRIRMGGQQPNMRTNSIIGSMIGNGTSSNPINLEAVKSPPSGSKQGKS